MRMLENQAIEILLKPSTDRWIRYMLNLPAYTYYVEDVLLMSDMQGYSLVCHSIQEEMGHIKAKCTL